MRERLPNRRGHETTKHTVLTETGAKLKDPLYVGVGYKPDGSVGEIFLNLGTNFGTMADIISVIAKTVSHALQNGMTAAELAHSLRGYQENSIPWIIAETLKHRTHEMLTKPFETYERPGLVVSYKVAEGTKIYKGALVALNISHGFLQPLTVAARFVGVANETVENGGAHGDKSVNVTKCGSFVFKAGAGWTPQQTDIGKPVVAVSDWEVAAVPSGDNNMAVVGTIVGLEVTSTGEPGVRVRIDNATV